MTKDKWGNFDESKLIEMGRNILNSLFEHSYFESISSGE